MELWSCGVSSIYLRFQFRWQRDFSLPTIDDSRVINNDGGTAEPLIDGSVYAMRYALRFTTALLSKKKEA